MKIGIAGAGIIGRMVSLELLKRGHEITLYDQDDFAAANSCSYVGAGILAPYSEYRPEWPALGHVGHMALQRWDDWHARLKGDIQYERQGILLTAQETDLQEIHRLEEALAGWPIGNAACQRLDGKAMRDLEPGLPESFERGLYFPDEGQINNRDLMHALETTLDGDIHWKSKTRIDRIEAGCMHSMSRHDRFDLCIDCRGLGASPDLPELHGVRGELVYLKAADVQLARTLRIAHPDHYLYIAPRGKGEFVVGATSIDRDDPSEISLHSLLSLLTAAYVAHPGFAEAKVLNSCTQCRPAFADRLPRIIVKDGLLRVNGLFRQGFLLAPLLAEVTADLVENKAPVDDVLPIIQKIA